MPAVSKAQQRFMGMVHAAQKGEKPASKDVADVAKDMSKKSAKDFASTKHKGLPGHVKNESEDFPDEQPSSDDLNLPSAAIPGVSAENTNEGPLGTMRDTKPTPTNNILWKATGKVCEGRSMTERVKMYEKKGGGWRMGKSRDEQVYNNLKEFYKNEIAPRKEVKSVMVKRRMGEATQYPSFSDPLEGFPTEYKQLLKKLQRSNDPDERTKLINKMNVIRKNIKLKPLTNESINEMTDEVGESDGADHEVSMARASLINIAKACQDLMGKIGSQEKDLPGWIQDHITNSENYIMQAAKGYHEIDDQFKQKDITGPTQLTQNGK